MEILPLSGRRHPLRAWLAACPLSARESGGWYYGRDSGTIALRMGLNEICGLPLAILMIREADDGDDEWCVLRTAVIEVGERFALDMGPERPPVPFPDGLEEQIQRTPENLRELLDGANYYIPFVVEKLASGEAHDFVVSLGFKWPGSENAN